MKILSKSVTAWIEELMNDSVNKYIHEWPTDHDLMKNEKTSQLINSYVNEMNNENKSE